ncbi:hypothetical protein DLAC_03991 [Tieghemostelium lacteum]|uniref:Uncharacterized protein n=1 Tax=Tieghemostelium lacteum TaxID=361077 RepID=A0A151ZRY8_TIELA|nr:hypothetical protein DLAC_03991 [Tieghemostelium lacteum]|eukprot:KYQ96698.1 hypothetical protein DLAC_03991 [Tieghemostelium lacteum]
MNNHYMEKIKEMEEESLNTMKDNQEIMEELKKNIENLNSDNRLQSDDYHNHALNLKSEIENLQMNLKKCNEREQYYKNSLDQKNVEFKELKLELDRQKKCHHEEMLKYDIKLKEMEQKLSETNKLQTQLESCKKSLILHKQNYDKQTEEYKKKIIDLENEINHRPTTNANHLRSSTNSKKNYPTLSFV